MRHCAAYTARPYRDLGIAYVELCGVQGVPDDPVYRYASDTVVGRCQIALFGASRDRATIE